MKKYFNFADGIILLFLLIGIAWIIYYKFFWTNTVPLLNNADITADIFYTVSTSIVASGIFYLFTIYIPKCFAIKKMKLHLTHTLDNLDSFINLMVSDIYNSKNKMNYNMEDFIYSMKTDKDGVQQDFFTYLSKEKCYLEKIKESIKFHIIIFNIIIDTHLNLLPKEIYTEIIELCRSSNQANKILNCYKPESKDESFIMVIDNILKIRNKIKSYYNIK